MKLTEQQLAAVLRQYGHEFSRSTAIMSGYRNNSHLLETTNGEKYNFIVYKDEPGIVERIERLNALSLYIAAQDLPVRRVVDRRILALKSSSATRYGCLYTYCTGETIPWEAYTKKHIKLLGMALGRFHALSAGYDGSLPPVVDEYTEIVTRMKRYFERDDVRRAMHKKLGFSLRMPWFERFYDVLSESATLPGQLPLHMDLVRSNVLFRHAEPDDILRIENLTLSGILDLEKAAVGHPLFDIARTLAFLLVDCPKPSAAIYRYLLDSGYRKRGGRQLSPVRLRSGDLLEQLVTLFLAYDLYKFLRQNPYESLDENHHYLRTVSILKTRQVLQ